MDVLPILLVSGLQVGALYALMALGYYVVTSATGIINFAQGEWAMIMAVGAVSLLAGGVPYWPAVLIGLAGAVVLAVLADVLVVGPLQRRAASIDTLVVALLGVLIVVRYGAGVVFGRDQRPLPGPVDASALDISDSLSIPGQDLLIFGVTALAYLAIWLFLRRTWLGRSFRVVAINPLGAQVCGINLRQMRLIAFAGGGLIAGLTGWLYAPLSAAGYLMGEAIGLKGFICLIVGGMTSLWGPLAGGLIVGVLEVLTDYYAGSIYSQGVAFILLLLFLMARPNGLLGRA